MTAFEPTDRLAAELPDLLVEIAAPRIPDYVDEVFAITAGTRQRPRWTFPERWLPMIIVRQRLMVPTIPWRPVLAVVLLLALLATALFVSSQQRRLPPPFGPARNGALVYDRGGDLFVRDDLAAGERLLVGGATTDFAPWFTRDGRHLIFLRRTAGSEGSPDERLDGFVADLDGSNPVDVTGPLFVPNWSDLSPDDSTLIVQAADPTAISFGSDDTRSTLYRVDLRHPGGAPQRIDLPGVEAATTPSFRGPDGAQIVFRGLVRNGPTLHSGVFAAPAGGGTAQPLTPTNGDVAGGYQQPLLSPDGRLLTYTTWLDPYLQIHIVDLASGEDRTVTPGGWSEGFATFSPDSSRIVFIRYFEGSDQIWIRPVSGGDAVPAGRVYPQVDGDYIQGSFSPDGRIAVVSDPAARETRLVDPLTGGEGDPVPWDAGGGFGWQRLAP
jgi:Tol biopolymer transport system component